MEIEANNHQISINKMICSRTVVNRHLRGTTTATH